MGGTTAEVLAHADLFDGLAPEELSDLVRVAERFECRPGERLFSQGDSADSICVVESGRLECSTRLPAQRELSLATLGPGDVIGELALLAATSWAHYATSSGDRRRCCRPVRRCPARRR
jgi:CRP-like cAMP-binding protein